MSPFIFYKDKLGIFFYKIHRKILFEKLIGRDYDINYIIYEYAQNLNTENYNKRTVVFWNNILINFHPEFVKELNRKKASLNSIYDLEDLHYEMTTKTVDFRTLKHSKTITLDKDEITKSIPNEVIISNSHLSRIEIENLKIFQDLILEKATILGSIRGQYQKAMRLGFFYFYLGEKISPNSTPINSIEVWKEKIKYKGRTKKNDKLVEKPFHITTKSPNVKESNNFSKSSVKKNILEILNYFETIEFKMGIDKIYKLCTELNIDLKD
tara:strand:- start:43735 stop:44538 length:804 start_codon:yes stop_codon:yes gene_type:complete